MSPPALLHNVGMPSGTPVNVRPPILAGLAFRWSVPRDRMVAKARSEAIAAALAELGVPDLVGVFLASYPGTAIPLAPGPALHGLFQRRSGPLYLPHRPLTSAPARRYDPFTLVFPT
ncbi:MAG: hypothetical protein EDX89_16425 [Acidobacteria bacterium]|nr:MAG: hypothetical protein EDX89_16425 [Acidobacteriota bacterium]MCE7958749.1 hypothetical protein [Acidobacteria bacterium ACB2]